MKQKKTSGRDGVINKKWTATLIEDEFGITFLWDSVHNIFNGYKTSSGNILENKKKVVDARHYKKYNSYFDAITYNSCAFSLQLYIIGMS